MSLGVKPIRSLSSSYCEINILIDPGHGGADPGHESINANHLQEKDLNLLIAKKFGNYLTTKLSNINVIYTRTTDVYPTLDERVAMANSQKVDYFISIHCMEARIRRFAVQNPMCIRCHR